MANDFEFKFIWIGTIKIKMFDGVFKTLTYGIHVLCLKRHLIRLSILDDVGCMHTREDKSLNVKKGVLTINRGERLDKFYKLMGNIDTRTMLHRHSP